MSEEQDVYQQMGRIMRENNADKEVLQELNRLKMRKLADSETNSVEALNDYLSASQPILNRMTENSNNLLELQNRAIDSTSTFLDSFMDLRHYLDEKFIEVDRKFSNVDRKFVELDRKFERKFGDLDRKFERKFGDLDRHFAHLNLQLVQLRNMNLNKEGEDVMAVPFLDGTWPEGHDLPEIKTVSDIEALTRDQCREYLTGYGISFRENETVNLKKKLRDVIGFSLGKELKHTLSGFNHQ